MRTALAALLFWCLFAPAAHAQSIDHETLRVVGWAKSCSVAIEHLGYPVVGVAVQDLPVMLRVGTLSMEYPSKKVAIQWGIDADGMYVFNPNEHKQMLERFQELGYTMQGSTETVPVAPCGDPEIDDILLTTKAISAVSPSGWPSREFRFHQINYSPLGTCAILIYRWTGDENRDFFQYLLARTRNPRGRVVRANAHRALADYRFGKGDLAGALESAAQASQMTPKEAETRYRYAAFLALSGHHEHALKELAVAVRLDEKNKERSRKDIDFENLYRDRRFKKLTR